jgi:ankyrin repeat protein
MTEAHLDKFDKELLPYVLQACRIPLAVVFESCPFCGKSSDAIEEHVSHYLQCLALKLLPGFDIDLKDKDGWTPLWWAAKYGHEAIVKFLLATEKVDVNSKDEDGRILLWWAATYGHEAIVKLLLEKGTNLESKDDLCWAPLLHCN